MDSLDDAFNELGFMSEAVRPWLKERAYSNAPQLTWVRGVAVRAWQRQMDLKPAAGDRAKALRVVLFAKVVSTAHGAIALLELGLVQQADALARVALEATFTLGAIAKDAAAATCVIADYHNDRRKQIQRVLSLPEIAGVLSAQDLGLQDALDESAKIMRDQEVKSKPVEQLARLAGMAHEYALLYTTLSGAVHSTMHDLDHFVSKGTDGFEVETGPDFDRVPGASTRLGQVLLAAMRTTVDGDEDKLLSDYVEQERKRSYQIGSFDL